MDPVDELLHRGVANIIPGANELKNALTSRKLNVYLGIDPTATRIHLGHAVPLRKLQQLVELGHHVTFLIGDFTALIGDTSDKDKERPVLTSEQITANFATYRQQAAKILDFSRVTLRFNSEWLSKLGFADILNISRHFSLNDFISRELIKKRLTEGKSVSLPETLYPVMQGYDSYFMDTDLQVGGTEQIFNIQAGRTLQKDLRGKDTYIITTQTLEGTDGRKMSKSWDNAIWLADSPNEMYGKIMSLKDELISSYFELATQLPLSDVRQILTDFPHPMEQKKRLASQIVTELHSKAAADSAAENFQMTFSDKQIDFSQNTVIVTTNNLIDALLESRLVESKSDARRLIEQGGIEIDNQKVQSIDFQLSGTCNVKVGKRKFAQLIIK